MVVVTMLGAPPPTGFWGIAGKGVPASAQKRMQEAALQAGQEELSLKGPGKQAAKLNQLAKKCRPVGQGSCAAKAATLMASERVLVSRITKVKNIFNVTLELTDARGNLLVKTEADVRSTKIDADMRDAIARLTAAMREVLPALPSDVGDLAALPALPGLPGGDALPALPGLPSDSALPALPGIPSDPALEPLPGIPAEPSLVPLPSSVAENAAAPALPPEETARPIEEGDATAEWELANPDAEVLAAEAQLQVTDGVIPAAKLLYTRAAEIAPNNHAIASARAALALAYPAESFATEVKGFLALEPANADEQTLRAYVLLQMGKRSQAQQSLAQVLTTDASHTEALRLQAIVGAPSTESKSALEWYARISASGQYDSNVAVLPDDVPSREEGIRALVDGSLSITPTRAPKLDVTLRINVSRELDGAQDPLLAPLTDVLTGGATARLSGTLGATKLAGEIFASQVLIDGFSKAFMLDAGGRLDARIPVRSLGLEIAPFVSALRRDFQMLNPEEGAEAVDNRDGIRAEAGTSLSYRAGGFYLNLKGAGITELTEGQNQRVRGALASLGAGYMAGALGLHAEAPVEVRRYYDRAPDAGKRYEQRLSPNGRLTFEFTQGYQAYAAWMYVRNDSRRIFTYTRQVGTLGVLAQW